MSIWSFLFVPTILFMVLVAPVWIVMHYRSKNREMKGFNQSEQESLDGLLATLDKLTERIQTLEEILDNKHPNWQQETEQEKPL